MHLNIQYSLEKSTAIFFFDDDGKKYLMQKLETVYRNKDHEVFLLGSELDVQKKYADGYYICDFFNVVYMNHDELSAPHIKEGCFHVTKNKHSEYCGMELAISPPVISHFISSLKSLNQRCYMVHPFPNGLATETRCNLDVLLCHI